MIDGKPVKFDCFGRLVSNPDGFYFAIKFPNQDEFLLTPTDDSPFPIATAAEAIEWWNFSMVEQEK
jgi:hypothetical protein